MISTVFNMIYVMLFLGGFCLALTQGERIFDMACEHIPSVAKWWDNFCESLPEQEDCGK